MVFVSVCAWPLSCTVQSSVGVDGGDARAAGGVVMRTLFASARERECKDNEMFNKKEKRSDFGYAVFGAQYALLRRCRD